MQIILIPLASRIQLIIKKLKSLKKLVKVAKSFADLFVTIKKLDIKIRLDLIVVHLYSNDVYETTLLGSTEEKIKKIKYGPLFGHY